jgi:hypothetical protein
LKENKEKYEKYLEMKKTSKLAKEKMKIDRDSRKIFIGGIRFDDLEALSKKGKLSQLKDVPPNKVLEDYKDQRKKW